jgi:hypothetical protein
VVKKLSMHIMVLYSILKVMQVDDKEPKAKNGSVAYLKESC